ncbi:MAG: hypothetical protein NUV80_07535 [Candidatus Berkelbacteria bacterium]|nr:hypothetical protein [Candidatus Berkelbacteria bacterium]
MKIKFLVDYIGRETAMKQYDKGDVDELSPAQALELIRLGVAEEVIERVFVPNNIGPRSKFDPLPEKKIEELISKIKPKAKEADYDTDAS